MRGLLVAICCALLCVPAALGSDPVQRPPVTWAPPGGRNFTPALHRKITTIVIHATEGGSLVGNVSWLIDDKSEASAHYVVSRDGRIVQLVPLHDVAWHSGNSAVNDHSVGIEHVGETYDPAGFSAAEYKSSARLVAWLVRRYDIPIDREHIIGHAEVPDPNHPGELGGSAHHTDPGPYWRWGYYLRLVRRYAYPNALKVATTGIEPGADVAGIVPWQATTTGASASRVDFLIDGRVVWSDSRRPFAFAGGRGWNTTGLANGTHVLTVRASGGGRLAAQRLVVHVVNRQFRITTSALRSWQKVKGTLRVRANAFGAKSTGLSLYVDGKVWSRDRKAPYTLRWNTRRVRDGSHRLTLAAVSVDGRVARRTITVVVQNHLVKRAPAPKPKPKPTPPPQVTAENIADGQSVSGVLEWRAHTVGPVARVEFAVDGAVVAAQTAEPWAASWDSSTVGAGTHVLEVRAYTKAGVKAVRDVTVTVTSPS
ncbi:MAG TPA: N-acetylmuramoyl-L-alanine amidase [Gaiellaceae bacterium]|nr:N-acetylmuramoyl-L-alanine amidase [Gaiellaceae bacterium]